jgi:hypothetical protein
MISINSASNDHLVLIKRASSALHNIKEHWVDHLPLFGNYVVPYAYFGYLSHRDIITTEEIDETLVIGDGLLLDMLQLELMRATWLLKKYIIAAIIEVESLRTL